MFGSVLYACIEFPSGLSTYVVSQPTRQTVTLESYLLINPPVGYGYGAKLIEKWKERDGSLPDTG